MDKDPRRTVLRSGLESLSLPADEALLDRLLAYLDLLQKWNQAYNLSAVRDPQQMVHQHLLDCLAALPAVDRHLRGREARILDVGSGAGLPGVVWALMRPNWAVCCVDAVAKKASFVRQVAAELALRNLQAEHARVEQLCLVAVDVVVSRAFASLADFAAAPGSRRLLVGHEGQASRGGDCRIACRRGSVSRGTVAGARLGRPPLPGLDVPALTLLWGHPPGDSVRELG
jgi:16S rRNA (guanine527-N7)-methyltransferase